MTKSPPPGPGGSGVAKAKEKSFASVNLLRGLSAFAVLFSHTAASVSGGQPALRFNFGSLAVDVFMLISGFLMMWHFYERQQLGERWDSPKTCLKFYIRRFFRIAPLYYFLLLIVYGFHTGLQHCEERNAGALHQTLVSGPHDPTSHEVTPGHILAHFSFLFGFIPSLAQSNPLPDWSIGLEMQFYLFFPFLALLLVRTEFVGGVVLLLAVNWLALHWFAVGVDAEPKRLGLFPFPTFLPLRILCFLVGMLLAAGLFEKTNGAKRGFLLLLALLVAGFYMKKFLVICFVFAFYELALGSGTGLPRLDALLKRLSWVPAHPLSTFAAEASYGVYLIHVPVLIVVIRLLIWAGPFTAASTLQRFLVCLGVVIPTVYLLAFLAHKYIEMPGIGWGRRIVKRVR